METVRRHSVARSSQLRFLHALRPHNRRWLTLVPAGWNGADYTLSAHGSAGNAGAPISTGTLDQGFQSTESVCLPNGCYTMTVASGYWSSEISWEVGSSSAGLVATSGAPVSCDFSVGGTFCANTCQPVSSDDDDIDDDGWYYYFYESQGDDTCSADDQALFTVAMSDSYGDGACRQRAWRADSARVWSRVGEDLVG